MDYRERYKRIGESEFFNKHYDNKSISCEDDKHSHLYTITREQQMDLYDREYERLYNLSKDELVKIIIGDRPFF